MEFGKIDGGHLTALDFYLPPDRDETRELLSRQQQENSKTSVYVGCAKWGRKDWIGTIYPEGTKESIFLDHYARHFNSIELNATFYRIPSFAQTSSWRKKVGKDFLFCPKVSQVISHIKRLKDSQELVDRFYKGIAGFGENLGPVFLMPHPAIGPKNFDTLRAFLEALPRHVNTFVELRHKDWFENKEVFSEVFALFQQLGIGSVITDAAGRRDCVHMRLTRPEAFIRFVGNGLHPTDYTRVDEWVQRIKMWMESGVRKIYFFMLQQEEIHSPALARYVIQQLNKHCNTALPEPVFVADQSESELPKNASGKN